MKNKRRRQQKQVRWSQYMEPHKGDFVLVSIKYVKPTLSRHPYQFSLSKNFEELKSLSTRMWFLLPGNFSKFKQVLFVFIQQNKLNRIRYTNLSLGTKVSIWDNTGKQLTAVKWRLNFMFIGELEDKNFNYFCQ